MIWLWFLWSIEAPLDVWESDPESTVGYGQPALIAEEEEEILGFIMETDMADSPDEKSEDELRSPIWGFSYWQEFFW